MMLVILILSIILSCYGGELDYGAPTLEIVARAGYPGESHTVITKDGFILTLHRIPYNKYSNGSKIGQPVFLQHGILESSSDWVISGNKSLAFILSDVGYDVWLGNARGNMYSKAHLKYPTDDSRYWDFSFHEMGVYDLPAIFDYITKRTQRRGELIYIGHSMGTTIFFVYSSIYKNANQLIKKMVALGPAAYMSHVRSPIKYLAPFANDLEWIREVIGLNDFLPSNKLVEYLIELGCDHDTKEKHLCEDFIFLFTGFDKDQINQDMLPMILTHSPAGTSTKAVIHYAQEIRAEGNFQQYDYGVKGNIKRYGTKLPPSYNVTEINVPLFLISAQNDWLATPEDVSKFVSMVDKKLVESYVVPLKSFNHIDFLWGKDAPTLVYKPLLKYIMNN